MNHYYTNINPVKKLLEELAGFLSLPEKWKGKEIDIIIKESKYKYLKQKIQRNKIVQDI